MSKLIRKTHSSAFKLKVVLETYQANKTIAQIASEYKVHPTQIHQWKKIFKEEGPNLFSGKKDPKLNELHDEIDELHRQIGKQKVEIDWLKKKSVITV